MPGRKITRKANYYLSVVLMSYVKIKCWHRNGRSPRKPLMELSQIAVMVLLTCNLYD